MNHLSLLYRSEIAGIRRLLASKPCTPVPPGEAGVDLTLEQR